MNANALTCFPYRLALPNNGNATVRVEQKVNGVYQYFATQQTQTTSGIFELVFTPSNENIRISVNGTSGFALQQISLDRDNVDTLVNTYLVSRSYRYGVKMISTDVNIYGEKVESAEKIWGGIGVVASFVMQISKIYDVLNFVKTSTGTSFVPKTSNMSKANEDE